MLEGINGNKSIVVNISDLAKRWYDGEFEVGYYDFYIYTPTEGLIERCKALNKVEVKRAEIEDLCNMKLLEFMIDKENGEKMLSCFLTDRIKFIKELRAKYDYSIPRLQQIVAYENRILPYSWKSTDFYYADRRRILPWLKDRVAFELEGRLQLLKYLKTLDKKYTGKERKKKEMESLAVSFENARKAITHYKKAFNNLAKKKWGTLSGKEKDEIKLEVFTWQVHDEMRRYNEMQHYYNKILHGYSPQVEFEESGEGEKSIGFEKIDWYDTFWNTQEYLDLIDFFKTPYFSLEFEGKEIVTRKDPEQVTAPLMRKIDKLYTIFASRVSKKRKRWGENSGRRQLIENRNREIRKLYAEWRKVKPTVASEVLLTKLCKHVEEKRMPACSTDSLKRIIYSKK